MPIYSERGRISTHQRPFVSLEFITWHTGAKAAQIEKHAAAGYFGPGYRHKKSGQVFYKTENVNAAIRNRRPEFTQSAFNFDDKRAAPKW